MTDRALTAVGVAVGLVTLFAVVAAADGAFTVGEAEVAGAFIAGAGLVLAVTYGRKQ